MGESTSLLSIRDVSNAYVSRRLALFGKREIKPVLNHVNLELRTGEIFGLTGKSGCGKTTLARCILGLINYEGEILLEGQKQEKKSYKVQMVFQEPGASLNPAKKIGWLMEEPLVIHKMGDEQDRAQKIDEMLLRVGLDPSYKTRRVNELSGGQKQRVCTGRALILQPRLLIADEAISSLDVSAGAQILNLFRELREIYALNILFISHNKDAVEYLCDRAAVMRDGRVEDFV
jgi:ABC-type dipeptide/oligopeptide/nickel transport system ATPase subunit